MKRLFLQASALALFSLLAVNVAFGQDDKDKKKVEKNMIVIEKKSDKDSKVTIEFKNGEVLINGKKAEDFKDEDMSIMRNKIVVGASPRYSFRYKTPRGRYPQVAPAESWSFSGTSPLRAFVGGNKAYLGVVTEKTDDGLKINDITKESAAEKAGLKEGDIIVKIDDKAVENSMQLTEAIGKYKPADKISVTYKRNGKEAKTTATLDKNKQTMSFSRTYESDGFSEYPAPMINLEGNIEGMGVDMDALNNVSVWTMRPRLGLAVQETEDGKGVTVLNVQDESPAAKAGIKEKDIITNIDDQEVNSADALKMWMDENKTKTSYQFKFLRDGTSKSVEVKIPKKLKKANL
jgi:serine protease Do